MVRPIVTLITDLKKSCLPVEKNENVKEIIQDLKDTLNSFSHKAVGITANQIGYNKKISYIRIPKSKNEKTQEWIYNEYILINAKITGKSRPIKVQGEGCLSFPGLSLTTRRYIFVTVEFENEKRQIQTGLFQDYESLAVQHEIDHTLGLTIFDRKWRRK